MHAHTSRVTPPCLGTKGSHPQKHRFTLFEIASFRLCVKYPR